MLLSQDKLKLNSFLEITTKTLKSHLNTLKKDFYIDSDQSRYYTILDENQTIQDLEFIYQKNLRNDNFEIDKGVYEIINNVKSKKVESLYFLDFLYNRYKTLSFIPFSLFQIGKQFLLELDKIKLLNEGTTIEDATNSKNQTKMKNTYFDKFCELIDDYTILKKSTAIGVMVDLEDCIKKIKSETLLELQNKTDNRNDYLDYLINEIEKQDYIKNADITFIQKWLNEYKISIEDILKRDFQNNKIEIVIGSHYNDMEAYSTKKDKALLVQTDFYYYFCKHFADELIAFFNSKKDKKQSSILSKPINPMKPFKDEYLTAFCNEISNDSEIYQSPFIQCYNFGIKSFTENLKSEISENLLILPSEKILPFIDFIEDKIKNTPYFQVDNKILDKWIRKYNLQNLDFPFIENKEVYRFISMSVNFHQLTDEDRELMEEIQIDFYHYAAMIEADIIIDFLKTKRPISEKPIDKKEVDNESKTPNQLSVNQAIILLDKLGVFTDKTFENMPNTKKAKILSKLLGRNEKNIKTAIEKLELKQSELGAGYQRDFDKIQKILDNLE